MKYSLMMMIGAFTILFYTTSGQVNNDTFLKITKTIALHSDLEQYLFDYIHKDKPSLFILKHENVHDMIEQSQSLDSNNYYIYYWSFKTIFHYNIEYWMEIKTFEVQSSSAYIEFKTFNSANTLGKRKKVKGKVRLKKQGEEWVIKSCQFVEW